MTILLLTTNLHFDVWLSASEVILSEILKLSLLHLAQAGEFEGTLVLKLTVVVIKAHIKRHCLFCGWPEVRVTELGGTGKFIRCEKWEKVGRKSGVCKTKE